MGKSSKKKDKVPKITEAQYAEYISSLKMQTENNAVGLPAETKNGETLKKT